MTATATFSGFPEAALQFLRDIEINNDKAWFQANKNTYETALLQPAQAFVTDLGQRLQALNPAIVYDTRTDGRGVLMRFYRDTRFSADKSPYKTHIDGMFTDGLGKKAERPAFGFRMGADNMALMAGMFAFSKTQLAAYRDAVASEQSGSDLIAALHTVGGAGTYHVVGEHYKRVPSGYDTDHPRADLLRYAGLYVHPNALAAHYLTGPELVDACFAHFQSMSPVYDWLARYVGAV